jgi:hypothetical protein
MRCSRAHWRLAGSGAATARTALRRLGGADEVEQVLPLNVVKAQSDRNRVHHGVGDAAHVPPLQPGVVLDADPG